MSADMDYMTIHDAAQAAYEAATPADFRYSATALRKAVDAGIAAAQALERRSSSIDVERVKVKVLEWQDTKTPETSPRWKAGDYQIVLNTRDGEYWSPQLGGIGVYWGTLAEAKAAAQAHYESALSTPPLAVQDGAEAYTPQMIRYDSAEAGDPYWEFITADIPAVTGPMRAANVEVLYDMQDRSKVIGMRVYDASQAIDTGDGEPVAQMLGPWDMEGDCVVWLEGCERLTVGDLLYTHPAGIVSFSDEMVDATRYRYLRGRDLDTIDEGGVFAGMTPDNVILNGDSLDAAIDAALSLGGSKE